MAEEVWSGIVMSRAFKKAFKSEPALLEDFNGNIRHYLSLASGLNIGNISVIAEYFTDALEYRLKDSERPWWGGSALCEVEIDETSTIMSEEEKTHLYKCILEGIVRVQKRYFAYVLQMDSFVQVDLHWKVATIHADSEEGKEALKNIFDQQAMNTGRGREERRGISDTLHTDPMNVERREERAGIVALLGTLLATIYRICRKILYEVFRRIF